MPVYTLFTELLSQLSSTWPHCGPQIPVCTLDHPVCHDLSGDMDVIPQEFLADPIKRKAVYVLGIHDACCKWWSEQAVTQQIFWAVCFYDRLVVPAGIDCHVMFLNGIDSRLYTDSFINLIRKLLPSVIFTNGWTLWKTQKTNSFSGFSEYLSTSPVNGLKVLLNKWRQRIMKSG